MGDVDGAGTVVTAGLIGRAIEPHAGEHGGGAAADAICLNCGTALIGGHCHNCGQAAHVHRTMSAIGHDIAHGVFHFEGKIWRTLPMLAFRPGELTRRYVAGERARFVSPMALFLFSVFLMFAVVANLPGLRFFESDALKPETAERLQSVRSGITEERAKTDVTLAELTTRLTKERTKETPSEVRILKLERRIAEKTKLREDLLRTERFMKTAIAAPTRALASENWLEARVRQAKENPKLLLYKIKTSAYKFSWALIPISLPFIWLLFPLRRDVGFYDHAVFATYSLTFMSLLVILLASLSAIGMPAPPIALAGTFVPPLHIYRQLKGAYRLMRAGALWRTFWMLMFAFVAFTFFVLLLLYLGVAD